MIKPFKLLIKTIIIFNALNVGVIAFTGNNMLSSLILNTNTQRIVNQLIGVAGLIALVMMVNWYSNIDEYKKDYKYCSLFSESIIPSRVIKSCTPAGTEKVITIDIEPNTKIIYWATTKDIDNDPNTLEDYKTAYGDGSNSGTCMSDDKGKAELRFDMPQGYTVNNKEKKPHVHYRVFKDEMTLGPIQTIEV
jgi:uncharacterized membrane protein YuzA (DUF378 family)